jgi:hypothetical protein
MNGSGLLPCTPFRPAQIPAVIVDPSLEEGDATTRFIKVIAGSVAVWPLTTRAQKPDRMRRLSMLFSVTEADAEGQARLAALRLGLLERG